MTHEWDEEIEDGDEGHINIHEELSEWWNRKATLIPTEGPAANNTAMIEDYMDEANPGDTLVLPSGGIGLGGAFSLVVPKCLTLTSQGAEPWSTWLVPLGDTEDPIVDFDLTVDSSLGVWANYGPSLKGIGFEMEMAPSAVALRVQPSAAWFRGERFYVRGGTRGFENHGPNATFDGFVLSDPSDCGFYIDDAGLEVCIRNGKIARNSPGTTAAYFHLEMAGWGGGEFVMSNVSGTCNVTGGGIVENLGIIESVDPMTLFSYLTDNRMDNARGPLVISRCHRVKWNGGYLNAADGTSACVLMDGSHYVKFREVDFFGGIGGGTYEWVGDVCYAFSSRDCTCPTGPVYKVSTASKPTDISVDDHIPGATTIGQVTNDVEWFNSASRRSWGTQWRTGKTIKAGVMAEVDQSDRRGVVQLGAGGQATVASAAITATSRILYHAQGGGSGSPGAVGIGLRSVGSVTFASADTSDRQYVWYEIADAT